MTDTNRSAERRRFSVARPPRRLGALVLASVLGLGVLTGCDDGPAVVTQSVESLVQSAQESLGKEDFNAAYIHLRNALKREPNNAPARLLMARLDIDMGNPLGAEGELIRAREVGADPNVATLLMAEAYRMTGRHEKILKDLKLTDEATPDQRAELLAWQAIAHTLDNDIPGASGALTEADKLAPDNLYVAIAKGRLAIIAKDKVSARAMVEKAEKIDAKAIETLMLKADVAFLDQDFKGIEAILAPAMKNRPQHPGLIGGLARAEIELGEYDKAEKRLKTFLNRYKGHAESLYMLAESSLRQQDFKAADQYAKEALANTPGHMGAQLVAGIANAAMGQFEQAQRYLVGYLADRPKSVSGRRYYAVSLMSLGRPDEARKILAELVDEGDESALHRQLLGKAAVQMKDFEDSEKQLSRAVDLDPNSLSYRLQLSSVLASQGRIDDAITNLEKALEIDPTARETNLALFRTYLAGKRMDEAVAFARDLQGREGQQAFGATLEAIALFLGGKLDEAQAVFERVLEENPGEPKASRNMAKLLAMRGQRKEAIKVLLKANERQPRNVEALLDLAHLTAKEGLFDKANDWAERARQVDSRDLRPTVALARLALLEKKWGVAHSRAQSALLEFPDNPELLTVLGEAQLMQGQAQAAVNVLEQATKAQPLATTSYVLLGRAYEDLGDQRNAVEAYRKALTLNDNQYGARRNLIKVLLGLKEYDAAKTEIDTLAKLVPDSQSVPETRAWYELAQGRHEEARRILRTAKAKVDVPSRSLMALLASLEWELGNRDGANALWLEWLKKVPDDNEAKTVLGGNYLAMGRWTDAEALYRAMLKDVPESWSVNNNLAWALFKQGHDQEALPLAQKAANLAPRVAVVLDTLGTILLDMKQPQQALGPLQKAADVAPGNAGIQYRLALALSETGDVQTARYVLKSLMLLDKPFAERADAEALYAKLENP
ncbi:MAG: PEP-CTERM system TPR-repeat protein PrsT [Rhodobacterales bacterium]|nr:PEP-CTERM system TPR-repeat protein PrsT [Rhodobacterales bacterium]